MAVRWKRLPKNITSGSPALLQANPGVDPYVPRAGSVLTIPLQTILPDAPRQGIVINLAELRLYYYPPGKNEVTVYPIGIGQLGAIRSRLPWSPPSLISALIQPRPRRQTFAPVIKLKVSTCLPWCLLARIIRWGTMRFAAAYGGVYLLHGTNADFGIGMRVSSGCIRLRDDDIKTLYRVIAPGTKVNIINTPIKVSEEPGGVRLVEIHQPLSKNINDDPQTLPINLNASMVSFKTNANTDGAVMERAMEARSGMPTDVTRHHEVAQQSM